MAYTTEYLDTGRGILHVGSSIVTGADIIAGACEEHRTDERARNLVYQLTDLTGVTELRMTSDEVHRVV
jgi:hypothetical protein